MYTNCLAKLDGLGMGGGRLVWCLLVFLLLLFFGGLAKKSYSKCCIFIKKCQDFLPANVCFQFTTCFVRLKIVPHYF